MEQEEMVNKYLRRSYFALDGLWFMMIEDQFSFDKALEIDEDVWRVLPKIQAREMKKLLGLKGVGLADFIKAISVKLQAEGYDYEKREPEPDCIQIIIRECPWYTILKEAKREHIAPQIADAICFLEFRTWLNEFGTELDFRMESRLCTRDPACILSFRAE